MVHDALRGARELQEVIKNTRSAATALQEARRLMDPSELKRQMGLVDLDDLINRSAVTSGADALLRSGLAQLAAERPTIERTMKSLLEDRAAFNFASVARDMKTQIDSMRQTATRSLATMLGAPLHSSLAELTERHHLLAGAAVAPHVLSANLPDLSGLTTDLLRWDQATVSKLFHDAETAAAVLSPAESHDLAPDEWWRTDLGEWLRNLVAAWGLHLPLDSPAAKRIAAIWLVLLLVGVLRSGVERALDEIEASERSTRSEVREFVDRIGMLATTRAALLPRPLMRQRLRVTANGKLRVGPSGQASLIGELPRGVDVFVIATDGRWRLVQVDGAPDVQGWIYRRVLEHVPEWPSKTIRQRNR